MYVSVTDAKAQLTDLLRRAEAGEEIILTRHGSAVATIVPTTNRKKVDRRAALETLRAAAKYATPGPSAARSQDFLYDDDGFPV